MKIFLKLLRESFVFALHEVAVNKVRTLLSLLGITIGIFSIISVFTIFDSMEKNIKEILGVSAKVKLVESKSIHRSEGKAVRVIDKREI